MPASARVQLAPQDRFLKVTWGDAHGADFAPYCIDPDGLTRQAKVVRATLEELVKQVRGAAAQLGVATAPQRMAQMAGPALLRLAHEGHELHERLFDATQGNTDEIRNWVSGFERGSSLTVAVGKGIYIPWGLLFADEPPKQMTPAGIDPAAFEGFWSLKYLISTLYTLIQPVEVHASQILHAFNEAVWSDTLAKLSQAEQDSVGTLLKQLGEQVYCSGELNKKWTDQKDKLGVLHFYCHANGTNLALTDDDLLDIDDLAKLTRERGERRRLPPRLVFLNGCATAVGASTGGFMEATGRHRFCGFVGTEAKVPTVFALRFGSVLLHRLFSTGEPIVKILYDLRAEHWPLSLLYSACCHPNFAVKRMDAIQAHPSWKSNFSYDPVGQADLELLP